MSDKEAKPVEEVVVSDEIRTKLYVARTVHGSRRLEAGICVPDAIIQRAIAGQPIPPEDAKKIVTFAKERIE